MFGIGLMLSGEPIVCEPFNYCNPGVNDNLECSGPMASRFEVSKVRFWHGLWCGNMALKKSFLDLDGITCTKDASLVANVTLSSGFI